ncbi:hypothetical protein D9M72_502390 [compost metagenome]
MEMQSRIALAELGDDARQELDGKPGGTGDAHAATAQPLQRGDLRHDAVRFQGAAQRISGKQFAGRARDHAARAPVEQRHAQQRLQCRDLPADRRHGHAQALRRFGQRAAAHHLQEVAQRSVLQAVRQHGAAPWNAAVQRSAALRFMQGYLKKSSIA